MKFLKLIRNIFLGLVFAYMAILIFEYTSTSHKLQRGGECSTSSHEFFKRITENAEFVECLSAENSSTNKYRNFIILMADNDDPDFGATGHGYIAWMRLSKSDEQGLSLHEFQTVHWGPNGDANIGWFHSHVKPKLPHSIRATSERLAMSVWRPGGYYVNETQLFQDLNGLKISATVPSDEDIRRFVRTPKTILSISIDDEIYDELGALKQELKNRTYSLLIHDCTALVSEAASKAGLYVPPRFLNPFPAQLVRALWKYNFVN